MVFKVYYSNYITKGASYEIDKYNETTKGNAIMAIFSATHDLYNSIYFNKLRGCNREFRYGFTNFLTAINQC